MYATPKLEAKLKSNEWGRDTIFAVSKLRAENEAPAGKDVRK